MRAIALSFIICLVSARADTPAEIVDLFASMAAALSDDNPAGFMKAIDPKMPDYDRLKTQIQALVQSSEVGSSVEPVSDEGDESKRAISMAIKPKSCTLPPLQP